MEYEPAFLELDRLSQGKPEQQMGKTIVPAQEPDWKAVENRAAELLLKTKDLRIAMRLTHALVRTSGLAGFADGLRVMQGIVERFWGGFYPKLDSEDPTDPTLVNTLAALCDGPAFIDRIRSFPIVSSRSFGRFSLRDIAISTGEQPPPAGMEPPSSASIEGAFTECAMEDLQATADAFRSAIASLNAMETFIGEKVGAQNSPNFSKLTDVLRAGEKILGGQLARRGAATSAATGEPAAEGAAAGGTGTAAPRGGPSMSGEINSREDVVRVLDKICLYYERVEPSSPLPILLQRCKRLVSASFLDIVKDLAPDALPQVENLRGKDPNESS